MERQIDIVVRVSSEEHAQLIVADIKKIVAFRTPIFVVGNTRVPDRSIQTIQEDNSNQF